MNESDFDIELQSKEIVLVDFWATWCGPCLHLSPIIDKLAEELEEVKVLKINVDEASGLSTKYGITALPTLLFFKEGVVVSRMVGLQTEDIIKEHLETLG